MKFIILFSVNLVALSLSFMALLSTCMWGCPNTGIQLIFKVSTGLLFVSLLLISILWLINKHKKR
jgi:hypothetical protein